MSVDSELTQHFPTATQWGTYDAEVEDGRLKRLNDYPDDPAPSIIGAGMVDAIDDEARIRRPMVRKSFLEKGFCSNKNERGSEAFVPVSWETALDLAASEIGRVRNKHGNKNFCEFVWVGQFWKIPSRSKPNPSFYEFGRRLCSA